MSLSRESSSATAAPVPPTSPRHVKTGVFVLEALNAMATTYFFYYAYFFMHDAFGFGALQNLILAAVTGFVYMFAAIYGGRFAQKRGYFLSLKVGFVILALSIGTGAFLKTATGMVTVIVLGNIGMCFTWPALQSIISQNETRQRLQSLTGIYNFTWAAGSAFAYFIGGVLIKHFGRQSMFFIPAAIHTLQLILTFWLEKGWGRLVPTKEQMVAEDADEPSEPSDMPVHDPRLTSEKFLKMAWLANPFAYVGVNTVVAVMPAVAERLNLPVEWAGFFCSTWFMVRAASFVFLRSWAAWHYRFKLLLGAYLAMVAGFAGILLAPNVVELIGAQIVFGMALSLIYYSSLFYSMDVGEAKGDHAGFHEGMIGLGTGGGPAVGAAAIYFFPNVAHIGVFAVSGLLACGLAGLLWLRFKR